jgi:GNAT superfamily N-acetyltransferase
LQLERFDAQAHDPQAFRCGEASLDHYIREAVLRDLAQRTAVAYVWTDAEQPVHPRAVLGYFTLSSFALGRRQARRRDRDRNLGSYDPVPAVLIGRLALDESLQGRGLGAALVAEALGQIGRLQERLGASAVVVHALDERAASFYAHLGFERFRDEPLHLYYPLARFSAAQK